MHPRHGAMLSVIVLSYLIFWPSPAAPLAEQDGWESGKLAARAAATYLKNTACEETAEALHETGERLLIECEERAEKQVARKKRQIRRFRKAKTRGMFSTHRCIGVDPEGQDVSNGVCHFRNVCILNSTFVYLVDDTEEPYMKMPRLHASARLFENEATMPVPFLELDLATFRDATEGGGVIRENKLHMYIYQYNTLNAGHVLGTCRARARE
mmetsp:Transcript_86024/g.125861  ORF Transcript_86024/g.125861 Transcript_86024/m.125861 type:complete len:212 (+) Transcript_86024:117-752(+)